MKPLEEPYRGRAVPPGTVRYWSWLFADRAAREPLLAMYALMAEWRALLDPATEVSAAQIKVAWWQQEIRRLVDGSPLHPVTRHIAAMPHAAQAELGLLERTVAAAATQLAGVPLERGSDLAAHADAMYGVPLLLASRLSDPQAGANWPHNCTAALAAAEYLSRAVADYGREVRMGRVSFPVEDLLAAQIGNDDLAAPVAPPRLEIYLDGLRQQAAGCFATAAQFLAAGTGPDRRHLAVLVTLGANHLRAGKSPASADFSLADLYNAWSAARRAAATR